MLLTTTLELWLCLRLFFEMDCCGCAHFINQHLCAHYHRPHWRAYEEAPKIVFDVSDRSVGPCWIQRPSCVSQLRMAEPACYVARGAQTSDTHARPDNFIILSRLTSGHLLSRINMSRKEIAAAAVPGNASAAEQSISPNLTR